MSYRIIAHMQSGEPIGGVIDDLPAHNSTFLMVKNPHRPGKQELDWAHRNTDIMLLSFSQVAIIEVINNVDGQKVEHKYPPLA